MKINRVLLTVLALFLSFTETTAQTIVKDFSSAIESGAVLLERSNGTGASSGSSVEGSITNETDQELNIDVYISKPIYLVNRGSGQNMVATQVYGRDGGYMSDGKRSFISLKPRERFPVNFIAYCADFEKDNPSPGESFAVGELPGELAQVMRNIAAFARANPDQDITSAAQVAVWLAQGESTADIATKFKFSAEDERLAYAFLR